MIGDLSTWQRLMQPEMAPLRDLARLLAPDPTVADIDRLRRKFDPSLVAAALELQAARRRAADKFGPEIAQRLVADRSGVEMASSAAVARHKVARFKSFVPPGETVIDLCCGIGGDAMALAAAGLPVVGVDLDPVRAWMCAQNAACRTICADVESSEARWFHLDPARRTEGGKRLFRIQDHAPSPAAWRRIIDAKAGGCRGGCIKLSPAVDVDELRSAIGPAARLELEYISENGRMSQAVAWLAELADDVPVRATAIRGDKVVTIAGAPGEPPSAPLGAFILEADDAIERARLLAVAAADLHAHSLSPGMGLLTAAQPATGPWFDSFEVLDHSPWNEKRSRAWLRKHDASLIEVKTRAGAADPDALQQRLRGEGKTPYTLFVLRIGRRIVAIITRRVCLPAGA